MCSGSLRLCHERMPYLVCLPAKILDQKTKKNADNMTIMRRTDSKYMAMDLQPTAFPVCVPACVYKLYSVCLLCYAYLWHVVCVHAFLFLLVMSYLCYLLYSVEWCAYLSYSFGEGKSKSNCYLQRHNFSILCLFSCTWCDEPRTTFLAELFSKLV